MNIVLTNKYVPINRTSWAIQCDSEQEAIELENIPEDWQLIGTRTKRIHKSSGKQDVLVKVMRGELRTRMFDKTCGKWYVCGKQVVMDELDLAEFKRHLVYTYEYMKQYEKEYVPKVVNKKK